MQSRETNQFPAISRRAAVAKTAMANGATIAGALVTAPILARALGPDGRGTLAAVLAPLALAAYLASMGLPAAANYLSAKGEFGVRQLSQSPAALSAAFGAAASVLVWFTAPIWLSDDPTAVTLLRMLAFSIPIASALGVLRGALMGAREYGLVNTETWTSTILRIAAVVGLAFFGGLNPTSASWTYTLAGIISGTWLVWGYRKQTRICRQVKIIRRSLGYGARASGGTLGSVVLARLDQLLMVPLAGAHQLGLYAVAVSVAELPGFAIGAVQRVLFSEQAAIEDVQLSVRVNRQVIMVTALFGLAASTVVPFLVPLIFGGAFRPAIVPMIVLLLAAPGGAASALFSSTLTSRGRPGTASIIQLIVGGFTVLALVIIVPSYGALGAAVVSFLSYWLSAGLAAILLGRGANMPVHHMFIPTRADAHQILNHLSTIALKAQIQRGKGNQKGGA